MVASYAPTPPTAGAKRWGECGPEAVVAALHHALATPPPALCRRLRLVRGRPMSTEELRASAALCRLHSGSTQVAEPLRFRHFVRISHQLGIGITVLERGAAGHCCAQALLPDCPLQIAVAWEAGHWVPVAEVRYE